MARLGSLRLPDGRQVPVAAHGGLVARVDEMGRELAGDDPVAAMLARMAGDPGGAADLVERYGRRVAGALAHGPAVARPATIFCVAGNSASHTEEASRLTGWHASPRGQVVHTKCTSAVCGPEDPIELPAGSTAVDYEGELGVVIGARTPAGPVSPEEAAACIAGYTVANDVTARDIVFAAGSDDPSRWQVILGKSCPTFAPLGPWVVGTDEVADVGALRLRTWVNGECRQDAVLGEDWLRSPAEVVADIASVVRLTPGDVILCGCPSGVGMFQDPPAFLAPGDVVTVEVDGIGALRNECRPAARGRAAGGPPAPPS